MSERRTSSSANGPLSAMAMPSRSTTAELFPALDRSAQIATLQQLFDAHEGRAFELGAALTLGAAIAERVAVIHAAGRFLGALDARRIRVSVDGRVSLARQGEGFLAPELQRGGQPSVASDVFAVAHLVHQLLTGAAPVVTIAVPPSRFNARLDAEIDSVLLAALREEPGERPASVMALQAALEGLAEELGLKMELSALGALVQPLLGVQVKAITTPPLSALDRLTASWLAAPGPNTDFDDDEDEALDDEVTHATPQRSPYALIACGLGLAAVLMTVVTYSVAAGAGSDTVESRRAAAPSHSRAKQSNMFVASAPAAKSVATPAPARQAKKKHRVHR